jgi:phospholipase C
MMICSLSYPSIYNRYFLLFLITTLFYNSPTQAQNTSTETSFNVLSWNIYMRPRVVMHDGQVKRAHAIVEALKNESYDVIVFEEAFDKKARRIIWNGLKANYSFSAGFPKRKRCFKLSTGVFIISKLPLKNIQHIFYNDCGSSDCLAIKGATLVSIVKNNREIQLVGTHLQAANGKKKTEEEIRELQYTQLNKEVLIRFQKNNVPQLLIGDLNINKKDAEYVKMKSALQLEDGEITGNEQYTASSNNDLRAPSKPSKLIDYVLCKKNGANVLFTKRQVKVYTKQWHALHKDLSDHYAIEAEMIIR